MTRETYRKITEPLRDNIELTRWVKRINRVLTACVFCIYPVFLTILLGRGDHFFVRAVLVPAISFVLVSIFRRVVNLPRPYEKFDMLPVLEKDTKGKSFPSRHVFSVFVIATTVFVRQPAAGVLLGAVGAVLGIIRVVGGVHEPKDITAGAMIGILSGWIGYYLIPGGLHM